jgi:type IV pilus assembly protein PilC
MVAQAGIAWSDGVLMLLDDRTDKDGRAVLQSLFDGLERGEALSSALRGSGYFPAYMAGMVETGEKTGRQTEALHALAEHYDRLERTAYAVKRAVVYPAILLVLMVAVVLVLLVRVLPIINDVFARLGGRLQPFALTLTRFGEWIGNASIVFALIAGIIILAVAVVMAVPALRDKVQQYAKVNWGGRSIFGKAAMSNFVSAMSLAMASGLDTAESVQMAASVSGGAKEIDEKCAACAQLLSEGNALSASMRGAKLLTAREARMLLLGERSGMGDSAMADIARRKQRDMQDDIDRIVSRVEPTLVIVASAVMGGILLSVMLPLMGVMTSIG